MGGDFVLGVDLDGVCGDHTSAFRTVVARERGIDPTSLGDQLTWDFHEWGLDDGDFEKLHRRAVMEDHFFKTMPVMERCAEVLWRLSDAGAWIRIITHRLYSNWGHATAVADTVSWLDSAGIPYRDLCFLGEKPHVEADVYIDDAPHNVEALRAKGATVIVFDQPYNRDLAGPRAFGWTDIEGQVLDSMASRGIQVQGQLPLRDDASTRLSSRLSREGPTGKG